MSSPRRAPADGIQAPLKVPDIMVMDAAMWGESQVMNVWTGYCWLLHSICISHCLNLYVRNM